MDISATSSIAMSVQALTGRQQASLMMIKNAAEQQQDLVKMLTESQASVTAYRGNNVNILA